jgi:hypothetical protein
VTWLLRQICDYDTSSIQVVRLTNESPAGAGADNLKISMYVIKDFEQRFLMNCGFIKKQCYYSHY